MSLTCGIAASCEGVVRETAGQSKMVCVRGPSRPLRTSPRSQACWLPIAVTDRGTIVQADDHDGTLLERLTACSWIGQVSAHEGACLPVSRW